MGVGPTQGMAMRASTGGVANHRYKGQGNDRANPRYDHERQGRGGANPSYDSESQSRGGANRRYDHEGQDWGCEPYVWP